MIPVHTIRPRWAIPDPPVLTGSFPASTSDNFRYISGSGALVDYVYEDGELKAVKETDEHRSLLSVKLARKTLCCVIDWTQRSTSSTSRARIERKSPLGPTAPPTPLSSATTAPSSLGQSLMRKDESLILVPHWDKSPVPISFPEDAKYLRFTAGTEARVKVFVLPVPASKPSSDKKLASPSSPYLMPDNVYIIRGLGQFPASYDSWGHYTKDLQAQLFRVSQLTRFVEELKRKYLDAGEGFYFDGALSLMHDGPRSAWEDGWSTRWNPGAFAQQRYFIAINPSGSTTFGQGIYL
ncbi:hypothetical protein BDM02DRAFT_3186018 [Thelephora ganbajun]|uniref:Uncharacterized protein n=1 Tax=Thelephora ganbajun TaxID=370292 RepID=A0ACB6ZJP5_THEGA|nr:hypothetical protein BDM02DRAFT_3186018 [Thelephora ganbajun]